MSLDFTIVIPTIGRESLDDLLGALSAGSGFRPVEVIVVDDRPRMHPQLRLHTALPLRVVTSGGRGPAAARNAGWRAAQTRWVCFIDDDVLPSTDWLSALYDDLSAAEAAGAVATQGLLTVPLPADKRPTDDERRTLRLASARWITADMAYRRDALVAAGGFDVRFPRAYREDSDLALRVTRMGGRIVTGRRRSVHPVAPARLMSSVHAQVGNRDNALMRRKFGSGWRFQVGEGQGRLPNHVVTVFSALGAVIGYAFGRRRIAVAAGCCWSALVGEFAARRFLDGPRTLREAAGLVLTSVLIPPVAVWHRLVGEWLHRHANPEPVLAVLLDRDDTLIEDGPFLNDPNGVRPLPGVPAALSRLRDRGLLIGVVTNQSGVARGLITMPQLAAVNSAVEAVIGPFDDWQVCVHGETDGCRCRKPQPGMVLAAAAELGVPPHRCVMIGDTGGDVKAARAAKAQAILIPTRRTRSAEVHDALLSPHMRVAANLGDAVDLVLKEAR